MDDRMPASGVRNSCEAIATKRDFSSDSSRSRASASRMSCSICRRCVTSMRKLSVAGRCCHSKRTALICSQRTAPLRCRTRNS